MSVVAVSLLIWMVAGLSIALHWRKSPLHLLLVLVLMTAIVGTFYPLAGLFVEPKTWRNLSGFDMQTAMHIQLNYLSASVALLTVSVLTNILRSRADTSNLRFSVPSGQRDFFVSTVLVAVGVGLYVVYVANVGWNILSNEADLAQKYAAGAGLGGFALGLNVAIIGCLWGERSFETIAGRLPFAIVGLAILVWAVAVIATRSFALMLLLGYAYIAFRRWNYSVSNVRPTIVVFAVLAWLLVEVFSILRGNWSLALLLLESDGIWTDIHTRVGVLVGGSEFAHPFITFFETIRDRSPGELGGASYIREAIGALPSAVWPERPETLAQEFARLAYPAVSRRGGGTGFSLYAEAWLNFGSMAGPFIVAFIVGSVLSYIEARKAVCSHGFLDRIAPALVLPVLMAERSSAIVSIKQIVFPILLAFAVFLAFHLLASSGHNVTMNPSALHPRHE